jgi:uridylate kinase
LKELIDMGVEVAVVVGGGNFFRGRTSEGMDRVTADHMGMLATAINALALSDALEQAGAVRV